MGQNKITRDDILAEIADVRYMVDGTLTIALVTMLNGSKEVGQSACVDPTNFDKALGEKYALQDAIDRGIWPKMGYALLDRIHRAKQFASTVPADPMFDGFKAYESKPITRMAVEIDDDNRVLDHGENNYSFAGIKFKAYQQPVKGDYVVRLTHEDTYHVARAVFHERNIVPS